MKYLIQIIPVALFMCWCSTAFGQNCQPLLTLTDDITVNEFFQAEVIQSSAMVSTANVIFQAEDTIRLTSGFQTKEDVAFLGYIADCILIDVEDLETIGQSISVYPNPTKTITIFEYELNQQSDVSLSVVDLLGRKIMVLKNNEPQTQGLYQIPFDARQLAPEVYFFRLRLNNQVITRKFVVLQ